MRPGGPRRLRRTPLVEASPLRRIDPRVKLAVSLCVSLAVMLPLARLALFLAFYVLLLAWARLLPEAARQVWRVKWALLILFAVDWWLVSLELAVTVVLRVSLLVGVFSLVVATTTPREFGLALERLGLPYRYAFSMSLAFASLSLMEDEWQAIWEAQAVRGALPTASGLGGLLRRLGDLVALTVPAVVLTTRRAWAITEAAYARGFDSPHRRPYHQLHLTPADFAFLAAALLVVILLFVWR